MKKLPLILAASLLGNVALLAWHLTRPPAVPGRAESPGATSKRTPSTGSPRPTAPGTTAPVVLAAPLDPDPARDLMARMRAAGFPADMILNSVQAKLLEQYHVRYAAILGLDQPAPPFWSSEAATSALLLGDPARRAALLALSREMTDTMRELFGPDYLASSLTPENRASLQRQYGDLPVDKMLRLQEISREFSQREAELLQPSASGVLIRLPEDTERLAQLERERRAAIAEQLTPQELEEYDLRSSGTAAALRTQLLAFEPSEEEFRRIFRLQWEFDQKYPAGTLAAATPEEQRERLELQAELRQRIAASLPPERAAAYLMSTENGASTLARLAARLELPIGPTVSELLAIQRTTQAQATALRADRTLTPEARNAGLAALQQQASGQIAAKIGPSGLTAYRGAGGTWLQNLVPPAPAPAPSR